MRFDFGMDALKSIMSAAEYSFDVFIGTYTKYKTHIVAYFKGRHTSGFVEGFNNKIKVIKRRCYGIFDENSLFRRIFLDAEGYDKYLCRPMTATV